MISADNRNSGAVDPGAVAALSRTFLADPANRVAMNAVTATDVDKVALNRERVVAMDHSVSHKADSWGVADQKKSGRCWIFAGLNSLRGGIMAATKVKDFELSQCYVHFWDKLEKANYFLTAMAELAGRPLDDRTVQHLLSDPIEDGGQWNMFVALVEKYGVVPQYAMPETYSSSNTAHMNRDLSSALRAGAIRIRQAVASGVGAEEAHQAALADVYRILTIHLGVPPERFVWQYRDKDNKFTREGEFTPVEFAERYVPGDLADYVCVVNDPRSVYGDLYTVEYLGNVVGAKPVTYLNAPIEVLKRAALECVVDGNPVWFGCDTEAQSNSDAGYWAADLYDYDGLYRLDLGMDKADALVSGNSMMTHAMVLTGVDVVSEGIPRRWRVENSWGPDKADKGFWTMDDSWFERYVYEVAVPVSRLPEEYRAALTKTPHVLPAWDPMGALA